MMINTVKVSIALVAVAVTVSAALVGCGSDKAAVAPQARPSIVLSEFSVKLSSPTFAAGKVTITAENVGAEEHEVVLVRAASVRDLPTKADGSVDEDKIAEIDKLGEIDHLKSHQKKSVVFDLKPGRYIAFCNLIDPMNPTMMSSSNNGSSMMGGSAVGHVHFALGMFQRFTVE